MTLSPRSDGQKPCPLPKTENSTLKTKDYTNPIPQPNIKLRRKQEMKKANTRHGVKKGDAPHRGPKKSGHDAHVSYAPEAKTNIKIGGKKGTKH
jgi:hypothetical protein